MTIVEYMTADHSRLDALLEAAEHRDPMDLGLYAEFRRGLLRHIALEEKILLPAARQARGDEPLEIAARLRLDHGAIAALLVPTPTAAITATLRQILTRHNAIEEGSDGMYAECDRLLASAVAPLIAKMKAYPAVTVNPHNDARAVMTAVEDALARAGYRLSQ